MTDVAVNVALPSEGSHTYGEASCSPGNVVTIITFEAPANWRFLGFLGGGDTDAEFWVEFDGDAKYRDETTIVKRRCAIELPVSDPDSRSRMIDVKVKNVGDGSALFDATLLGELR